MTLLVSACLLGIACRYDSKSKGNTEVLSLLHHENIQCIPFCPEVCGGLAIPRPPAERVGENVLTADGTDVTEAYRRGAQAALDLCRENGIRYALLKEKSPSCGKGLIHDGGFGGGLKEGDGVTTELLEAHGIRVFGESQIEQLLEVLKGESR